MTSKEFRARSGVSSLLSNHNSNPKVAKAEAKLGIRTAVLHLAPGDMSGREVCPNRSPGCSAACLHFAGNPMYQDVKTTARIKRTNFFFENRELFMQRLKAEIASHERIAIKNGLVPAVRLNGTSDLAWERIKASFGTIVDSFPNVMFYDYTAVINRLRGPQPKNYVLVFSEKENNHAAVLEAKALGFNIASVFEKTLPEKHLGLLVIDGDEHDYRPHDPKQRVIGLKVKGKKGKADLSGFVTRPDLAYQLAA